MTRAVLFIVCFTIMLCLIYAATTDSRKYDYNVQQRYNVYRQTIGIDGAYKTDDTYHCARGSKVLFTCTDVADCIKYCESLMRDQ